MTEVPDLTPVFHGVVYRLTCIHSGKSYIGITRNSAQIRFRQHIYKSRWPSNKDDQRRLMNALRKYPPHLWTVEEIGSATTWVDLCRLEVEFIAKYGTQDRTKGYNHTAGGDGRCGHKQSPEEIEKRAAKLRGQKRSPESRRRMSDGMRGKTKIISIPELQKSAERDAAIAADHFKTRSLRVTGELFGIKESAVCSALKRVHERIAESVASAGCHGVYQKSRPMMIHPEWLDLAI